MISVASTSRPISQAMMASSRRIGPTCIGSACKINSHRTFSSSIRNRFFTSSSPHNTSTAPSTVSSSSAAQASSSSSIPIDATLTSQAGPSTLRSPTQIPYIVPRTENGELPVYSKLRRGNMWKTIIRNVQGDVSTLQSQLNTALKQNHIDPLKPSPVVTLRPTNRHLEIKGRWVSEVKGWLEEKGF